MEAPSWYLQYLSAFSSCVTDCSYSKVGSAKQSMLFVLQALWVLKSAWNTKAITSIPSVGFKNSSPQKLSKISINLHMEKSTSLLYFDLIEKDAFPES